MADIITVLTDMKTGKIITGVIIMTAERTGMSKGAKAAIAGKLILKRARKYRALFFIAGLRE
jgi:hypothetical protein